MPLIDGQLGADPPVTDAMRHSLRSKVAHAAEILHAQGPIGTFIHTNPLHSLEHLPFEQAVQEAERLLGGRGYLSNEEFRWLYRTGRITADDLSAALADRALSSGNKTIAEVNGLRVEAQDIHRIHLLYGIESLAPSDLHWRVRHEKAPHRFRKDVPPEKRALILQKAATELRLSLDRVGREWTLAEWVQAHTNLDLTSHLRDQLCHELREEEWDGEWPHIAPTRHSAVKETARWLDRLEIPLDRRQTYLTCIDRQMYNVGIYATKRRGELHARWLKAEARLLRDLVPRHLGTRGTFLAISRHFERHPESYAILSLWNAVLASRGLNDPLSTTNPQHLYPEGQADRVAASIYGQVMAVERDGGLSIPLTADLKEAIETKVAGLARRQERRETILTLLSKTKEQYQPNAMPPLTLTTKAQSLLAKKPRGLGYSSPLVRLLGELRMRTGFWWATWDDVMTHPLLISTRPVDDEAWRRLLRDGLRVRLTDGVRASLLEKYATRRQDQAAEQRRQTILAGLLEDGLTLSAWDALQEDAAHWTDGDQATPGQAREEERLCRLVLDGLRPTELTRKGLEALDELITLRGRTSARRRLLADLRKLDPREQMIRTAHKILAEKMASLGHDLALSDFLRRMTGLDLTSRVNHYMIKWCAAFLDEGIAAWSMPGRNRGFYAAWKVLARHDWSLIFTGVRGWREAVRGLPDRPEDALIHTLHGLGIPEDHWTDYLARRLVQLPGWAGLIKWREHQPRHPRQQHEPIDLVEYLAVRLFCESLLIKHVCRTVWGLDGTARSLHRLFRDHPSEFMVRRELSLGGLPGYLDQRARDLVRKNPQGQNREEWIRLAEMIWLYRQSEAPGHSPIHTLCRNAWRLFHLAQFLGLSANDVRSLSVDEADRILAALDSFPSSVHGPVWLQAYEQHYQTHLLRSIVHNQSRTRLMEERPRAQLALCVDEREESLRRHIEAQDPAYETFGTAGFFGVAMNYSRLGEEKTTPLCPVVVSPVHRVLEVADADQGDAWRRASKRNQWLKFSDKLFSTLKADPIASYFLIDVTASILGVVLLGKTLFPRRFERCLEAIHRVIAPPPRTTLLLEPTEDQTDPAPTPQRLGFALDEQAGIVEGQLRIMGLTGRFARLVLFLGHGSTSQNNPHESAYDCGACGGKHGGPNGRALAAMANRPEVRFALRERGIDIPSDTYFLGAQHNTASDDITYFDAEKIPATHRQEFRRLAHDLDQARALNARERCRLLPMAPQQASPARSLRHAERRTADFSQVRPEWGHATNASVVVGRRSLTQGLDLGRRAFLQSYDPKQDPDGVVLERILTAVVPVAVGISLEYYFSTVDNQRFGCSTKTRHNVTGLIGVMEGTQSDLRTGLPFQMIGIHEALRLTFVVEANPALLNAIVQRHRALQKLFDRQWAHLVVLDIRSGDCFRYEPKGRWHGVPIAPSAQPTPVA